MDWNGRQFADTARAFDSVAADYDGPSGNNALVQIIRARLWAAVAKNIQPGARLLDLGCGTGIDAAHFSSLGYSVLATDSSPQMVTRTRTRLSNMHMPNFLGAEQIGIQELERLGGLRFDALYSDLGPLNCVPDLRAVARSCSQLLHKSGLMLVSVIGKICPWEFIYYALRGDFTRAGVRFQDGPVEVSLNNQTVMTRYYTPREFYAYFAAEFDLVTYRTLNLFLPPPYLIRWYELAHALFDALEWVEAQVGAHAPFREAGDHFLMILRKRD